MGKPSKSVPDRRRWFRFRLRTLFLVMTVIAVILAFIGRPIQLAIQQRAIAAKLQAAGMQLDYKYDYDGTTLASAFPSGNAGEPPQWIRGFGGDELFGTIWRANYAGESLDNETLDLITRLSGLEQLGIHATTVPKRGWERLSRLKNLAYLRLKGGDLADTDIAMLKEVENLAWLDLDGTDVTDADLDWIAELPKLDRLKLDESLVTAEGVERLKERLPALQIDWTSIDSEQQRQSAKALRRLGAEVSISSATLGDVESGTFGVRYNVHFDQGIPNAVGELKHLTQLGPIGSLRISGVKLGKQDLGHVATVKKINRLTLTPISFPAQQFTQFQCLPNLRALLLDGAVTDQHLAALTKMSRLEFLWLCGTPKSFTKKGLANLSALQSLKRLTLTVNSISDINLQSIGQLTELDSLTIHSIDNKSLSEAALLQLGNLARLERLDLPLLPLSDAGIRLLAEDTQLRSLRELRCEIGDDSMELLARFPSLETLWLYGDRLTDDGLDELANLSNLRHLHLASKRVTDKGLWKLRNYSQLKELGLPIHYQTITTVQGVTEFRLLRPDVTVLRRDYQ